MKRKLIFLVMLLVAVLGFSTLKEAGAATISKLNIYYYRYDNFENGNEFAWLWSENTDAKLGTEGEAILMAPNADGFGRKVTYEIPSKAQGNKFGLLFCKSEVAGGWGGTQTPDMYFKLSQIADKDVSSSGEASVYYIQGEKELCFNKETAKLAMRQKFDYLSFDGPKTISYTTFGTIPTAVEVYEDGQLIPSSHKTNKITLNSNVDLNKEYRVKCKMGKDDVDQLVSFDGIYSSDFFNESFGYEGDDLGANYTKTSTTFKLWAPVSSEVSLNLYNYGHPTLIGTKELPGDDKPYETVDLVLGDKGVWSATVNGDLDGKYYTYNVTNNGKTNEVVDPYARTTGVNGMRGMIVDFSEDNEKLNPSNWKTAVNDIVYKNNVDKIIYESHIRDLTADKTWGGKEAWAGRYLGLSQRGTTYTKNGTTVTTGLDHLIELGITHLHLLPLMDSEMVDETRLDDEEYKSLPKDGIYNWGYMTKYFFSVDGCYSTNPYDGYARLLEYKTMIAALHENDINIIMDVVFNHSSNTGNNPFQLIVPNYFYRTKNGILSNGSGTGNELASERFMVNKMIRDSVTYFADEFKVDGFRFDLMALEDTKTMNQVYDDVAKIDKDTIIYGEPWTGGDTPLSGSMQANKKNMNKMPNVASFADVVRDGIRGDNFPRVGWITGNNDNFNSVAYGIVGGNNSFNSATSEYTYRSPNQLINYITCHDNHTLYDQVKISISATDPSQVKDIASQGNSIVLTSQGVPFIEGGSEIFRTKKYKKDASSNPTISHNSYNLGDYTNVLKYNYKVSNLDWFNAIRDLIKIRKEHHAFKLASYNEIAAALSSNETLWKADGLIGYQIHDERDTWNDIYVVHANMNYSGKVELPKAKSGSWEIVYSNTGNNKLGKISGNSFNVGKSETVILVGSTHEVPILPDVPEVVPEDEKVKLIKDALDLCLAQIYANNQDLSSLEAADRNVLVEAATKFMNANYNSVEDVNKAFKAYEAAVKDVLKA